MPQTRSFRLESMVNLLCASCQTGTMECSDLKPVFRSSSRNVLRCNKCEHVVEIVSKGEGNDHLETFPSDQLELAQETRRGNTQRSLGGTPGEAACRGSDKEPDPIVYKMNRRGIEFSLKQTQPGLWQWQFQIGDTVMNGKTATNLRGMAAHRVQQRIDREIKRANDLAAGRSRVN